LRSRSRRRDSDRAIRRRPRLRRRSRFTTPPPRETPRCVFRCGAAERLPFPNRSFDAVFDFGVLHRVPDWQAAVAEIARVLKPSGRFYFEEVTAAALDRWIYRALLKHPAENRFDEARFLAELSA
jgi:ubiquinone/menaquinone biosynthesis C-methylase UbiE